jgi:protein-S-isoprenylcysteine O-methyltransferase Ste14
MISIVPIFAAAIRLIWLIVEYLRSRRYRIKPAQDWDRHSATLWDIANLVEPVGMVIGFTTIGRIQTETQLTGLLGLVLLVIGIVIRWWAIHTLGKYFTYTVLIKDDHRLIRAGIYKHLRHPSYAGALLAHVGLGLSFSNWFSLAFSSIPYFVAAFYRMRVEEQALASAFGAEYIAYTKTSKRLIPRVY